MTMLFSDSAELTALAKSVCFANLTKDLFRQDMATKTPSPANFFGGQVFFEFPLLPTSSTCKVGGVDCTTQEIIHCTMHAPVFAHTDTPGVDPGHAFSTDDCDSKVSQALGEGILTADLALLFQFDAKNPKPEYCSLRMRGIHAGAFHWVSAKLDKAANTLTPTGGWTFIGDMAGTNSTGIALGGVPTGAGAPGFVPDNCNASFLHGRLTGRLIINDSKLFNLPQGMMVSATYRISYDPGPGKIALKLNVPTCVGRGVLSGVLLQPCQA